MRVTFFQLYLFALLQKHYCSANCGHCHRQPQTDLAVIPGLGNLPVHNGIAIVRAGGFCVFAVGHREAVHRFFHDGILRRLAIAYDGQVVPYIPAVFVGLGRSLIHRFAVAVQGQRDFGNLFPFFQPFPYLLHTEFRHSPVDDGTGKYALTHYKTIKRANGYSLVELKLETGRKNQIRVHMSDLGHPVLGDERYGCEVNPLGRMALHAFKLCFYHPVTGDLMEFETPYPAAFKSLMLRKQL